MAQISKLLVDAYIAKVEELYQLEPEEYRPTIVKEGRLQDDPSKKVFTVSVSPNDYADESWADVVVASGHEALDFRQMRVQAYEVGGGQSWWRRGIIEYQIFGMTQKYTPDHILDLACRAKTRIEMAVSQLDLTSLTDEFGEVAKISLPVTSNMFRSGGEKANALIWRGKVKWQVMTERPW